MKVTNKFEKIKEKIKAIENLQKELSHEYHDLSHDLQSNDFAVKYEKIEEEFKNLKIQYNELLKEKKEIQNENFDLKLALKEQLVSEKTNIINISKKKLDIYFDKQKESNENNLNRILNSSKNKINEAKEISQKYSKNIEDNFINKLDEYYKELEEKIKNEKIIMKNHEKSTIKELENNLEKIKNEELSEEVIKSKMKQNKFEIKFGLNILNKVGIILILLGVATAFQYSYSHWFNDYLKGIFAFLLGGIFLGVGEFFFRKNTKTFALGMLGGGIGILYSSVFFSFFSLKIINMPVALLLAVFITVLSILMSLRYNSQTICAISLIGGYLPVISYYYGFDLTQQIFNYILFYIALLNIIVLVVAIFRKWIFINYISYFLHIPAMIILTYKMNNDYINISYITFTYILYMIVSLIYPIRYKIRLSNYDRILTGINTVISFSLLYKFFQFGDTVFQDYLGLLVITFAIIYFILGYIISKKLSEANSTILLYFGTAFTFAVLAIPVQLGIKWLSLGWLIESMVIIYYAIKINHKKLTFVGFTIFALCLIGFFVVDVSEIFYYYMDLKNIDLFIFKYSSITIATLFVLYLIFTKFITNTKLKFKLKSFYKAFSLINLWIFEIVFINYLLSKLDNKISIYILDTIILFVISAISISTGYLVDNMALIKGKFTKIYSYFLYFIGFLLCIAINSDNLIHRNINIFTKIIFIVLIILYNLFLLQFIRNSLKKIALSSFKNIEFYPIFFTIIILANTLSLMIGQFGIEKHNLILSLVVLMISLANIFIGFKKGYRYLRISGLILSILTTIKTFFFDLSFLESSMKIVAYFGFGITLLIISFIYQKMKEKLEVKL